MKRTTKNTLHVRQAGTVDFLDVPNANIVDLRPKQSENDADVPLKKRRPVHTNSVARQTTKFFLLAVFALIPVVGFTVWQRVTTIQGTVLGASTDAAASLRQAGQALTNIDATLAEKQFAQAAVSFQEARSTLDGFRFALNGITQTLPGVSKVKTADALLAAGKELADAGTTLASLVAPMLAPADQRTMDFPTLLTRAEKQLPPALDHVDAAIQKLHDVAVGDLPVGLRPTFQKIEHTLPAMKSGLAEIRAASNVLFDLVGGKKTQRYLILFQDNLELRPTGGFMGSLALVDIADGKVSQLQVPSGGTYDFKGQLTEKVISPEPLHLVNPQWQLQDANWWPDFPTSAKKILWFYQKSGGPSVDGILAVTPDVISDLLAATGPIDMTETYGTTITAENLVQETLKAETVNPDRPKQIIADLVPRVLDRIMTTPSLDQLSILSALEKAIREKQLLVYFSDAKRQADVHALGWDGALTPPDRDGLLVVDTNIGGGKTDGVIDEKIDHTATIAADGSIVDSVTITRTHNGTQNDPITGTRNVDYVRVYVPKGSTFVSADGFERIDPKRFQVPDADAKVDTDLQKSEGRPMVDELSQTTISTESGFTVFANWMGVGPGETATAHLTYMLPFRLHLKRTFFSGAADRYSLLVQKQPGTNGRFFTTSITYPTTLKQQWETAETGYVQSEPGRIRFAAPLETNQLLGIVLSTE
ncbi:MAG: DUF4012 domain-containing protein [bacterium]